MNIVVCSIETLACGPTILAPSSTCAIQCHMAVSFLSLTDGNHDYGDVSLSSLLRFMTGLSVFPPMDHGNWIPFFSACTNTVILPISYSIDERDPFISAFVKAFQFGGGFGSA